MDDKPTDSQEVNQDKKNLSIEITPQSLLEEPPKFMCPIGLYLMVDPVIDANGDTYDRKSIEKWFEKSQKSPLTNEVLSNKNLIPNNDLKSDVMEYMTSSIKKILEFLDPAKNEFSTQPENRQDVWKLLDHLVTYNKTIKGYDKLIINRMVSIIPGIIEKKDFDYCKDLLNRI